MLISQLLHDGANLQALLDRWWAPRAAPESPTLVQKTGRDSLSLRLHEDAPPPVATASATLTSATPSGTNTYASESVAFKEGPRIRLSPRR